MFIGKRMKDNYEDRSRIKLIRRMPVIMRLDGKAFHTLTRKCAKPFDKALSITMDIVASRLLKEIQGAKCAYIQSDEISILITDFDKLVTDAWFDYNVQKMTSVSAGIASAIFSKQWYLDTTSIALFDSRVFNIPKEEVCNYFIWRQKDWERNSISMLARAYFSHKALQGKNSSQLHEMLHKEGVNWADLEPRWKNGVFMELGDITIHPIFTKNRAVIERYLYPEEEETRYDQGD